MHCQAECLLCSQPCSPPHSRREYQARSPALSLLLSRATSLLQDRQVSPQGSRAVSPVVRQPYSRQVNRQVCLPFNRVVSQVLSQAPNRAHSHHDARRFSLRSSRAGSPQVLQVRCLLCSHPLCRRRSQARSRRSSLAACQLGDLHRSQHCNRVFSLVQFLRPSQPKCPRGNRVRCPAHSQVCSQAPALPRSRRSNLVEIRPHSPVYVQALCLRCSLLLSQVSDPVVTQALNQPDGQVRNPQRTRPLVLP